MTAYLLDLSGQHAPLDPQDGGDVDVLPRDRVEPGGEAVHCGQEQHPGELQDVEDPLDDIIWRKKHKKITREQNTMGNCAALWHSGV